MIRLIDVRDRTTLDDYASQSSLWRAVEALRRDAARLSDLSGRTVWMVNSTGKGGGVAEMLPKLVSLLREVGVDARWAVVGEEHEGFFALTKCIHNMLHGVGEARFGDDAAQLYASESRKHADALANHVKPDDIVVVHDPQPLAAGAFLARDTGVTVVWRCHIGNDVRNDATNVAWHFLQPWIESYDRTVFSLKEYVPPFLEGANPAIIPPSIDPLTHKNKELSIHELTSILIDAGLTTSTHPAMPSTFDQQALRLQPDGSFSRAYEPDDIGFLFRPIITQVSRWDHLKGFVPLLRAFAQMKQFADAPKKRWSERDVQRIRCTRMVLAGPDPASIQDDPEGVEAFDEVKAAWTELPQAIRKDASVIVLPMDSRRANALMVNAIQRCSTIVVQNSLREGFGLTATEAMWKGCPVLGTTAAGLRAQIEDEVHGRIVADPQDSTEIGHILADMLSRPDDRKAWGRNAHRRVCDEFLIFSHIRNWLSVLNTLPNSSELRPRVHGSSREASRA